MRNTQPLLFLILAILMSLSVQPLWADTVMGNVIDAETSEPLEGATVRCAIKVGESGTSIYQVKTDSLGHFSVRLQGRITMEVSMLGYYSKTQVLLALSDNPADTLDAGTIALKMSPQMMKMVEVTARARRFTVRGDTIVFNPEAFHLEEGARLDDLIRQLPGVEVDSEGRMSWNGNPIRLTMDGESMLGGDDLLRQLPAEAVQNIKAYNKASELTERTGRDDGTKDMVLDLTIKPGFLDRVYGDVSASAFTEAHYATEATLRRLSKSDPLLLFATANDIGNVNRRYMTRGIYMGTGQYGHDQALLGGYQHKWQRKAGSHDLKSQYSFSGGVGHTDTWNTNHTLTDNYFPQTTANRTTTADHNYRHGLSPTIMGDLRWATDSLNTFTLSASVEHGRTRSVGRTVMEQADLPVPDVLQPYLSQLTTSRTEGRETAFKTKLGWEHYIDRGALGGSINWRYTDGQKEQWYDRTVTSHVATAPSSQLTQYALNPSHRLSTDAEVHHARSLAKWLMLQAQYTLSYNRNRSDQDFTTDGTADPANSFRDHYSSTDHSLLLHSTISIKPIQLTPSVTAQRRRERSDYQRGQLDTIATRRATLLQPALRATWKLAKTSALELNYSYDTSQPNIITTLAYRDATDPLFIREGNPNLTNTHTHNAELTYNLVVAPTQSSFTTSLEMGVSDNDVTTALRYDPQTAVYVSRPALVRGSRHTLFRFNYDQGIGDYYRLQNSFRLSHGHHYGYLTQLPSAPELERNRLTSLNPADELNFSYDKDWLNLSLRARVEADHIGYTASPEQNTTLWNNEVGIRIKVTYRHLVFQTNVREHMRRGYSTADMNTSWLLWDGSVKWKILHNKATLGLEFDDILNSRDSYYSHQSAYQTTTTFNDFRHHYAGLSFTYHFDAKAKE